MSNWMTVGWQWKLSLYDDISLFIGLLSCLIKKNLGIKIHSLLSLDDFEASNDSEFARFINNMMDSQAQLEAAINPASD